MSQKIVWKLDINVMDGPKVSETSDIPVEAYDKIIVRLGTNSERIIDVQPSGAGQVLLFLIKSSHYKQVSYKVVGSGKEVMLDSLQLFLGSGAADGLGQPLQKLHFVNKSDAEATIQILVGRIATSEPQQSAESPQPLQGQDGDQEQSITVPEVAGAA
jgi:hypothetical protein